MPRTVHQIAKDNRLSAGKSVVAAMERLIWIYEEYKQPHPEFASHVLSVIMCLDSAKEGIEELRKHLQSL